MNPKIKKLWTDALRSGNYKQCQNYLEIVNEGNCCLGVLCREYEKDTGLDISKEKRIRLYHTDDETETVISFDGDTELLPQTVLNWAGLLHSDVLIKLNSETTKSAASLNDDLNITFNNIADLIEKDPGL